MRVGINVLYLIPNHVGGTETYARGLIEELEKSDKHNEYYIFCNKENFSTFKAHKNIHPVLVPITASNRALRLLLEQILLPIFAKLYKLDLLHSLGYTTPFFMPCKSIVTIHDLNWYYHPEDFSLARRIVWKFMVKNSAKSADLIIADSFATEKSIKDVLSIKNSKIKVVYPGTPKPNSKEEKYGTVETLRPYILTVSAAYPHKNLITLLKAFNLAINKISYINLIIVGLGGKAKGEIKKYLVDHKLEDKVHIAGYVDNAHLAYLYKSASCFVFPSAYEGFGFPVLEAMSHGVPVISSNAYSLREVVGNSALLFKPYDFEKLTENIIKLFRDDKLKEKYKKLGNSRVNEFSWHESVITLVNNFKEVIDA